MKIVTNYPFWSVLLMIVTTVACGGKGESESTNIRAESLRLTSSNFDVSTFRPWTGYGIEAGPDWLVGDLNGDTRADLVHLVSNYVHTWMSNGDGTFAVGSFTPWPEYSVSSGRGWRAADLNGDGKMDLVHLVSDYVYTWISEGNGTFDLNWFRPWSGYSISAGPDWLTGDVNGDGKTDLVHLVSDYVHTWVSNGDSTFAVGTFQPWSGYGMSAGRGWRVGDWNADGRTDLIHLLSDYVHPWLSAVYRLDDDGGKYRSGAKPTVAFYISR